jgi:hypothetical protein
MDTDYGLIRRIEVTAASVHHNMWGAGNNAKFVMPRRYFEAIQRIRRHEYVQEKF